MKNPMFQYEYIQTHIKTFLFLCIDHIYVEDLDCYLFLMFLSYII